MKKKIFYGLALLILCLFGGANAQSTAGPLERKHEVNDDLIQAAKKARVELNDELLKAFTDSASSQNEAFRQVYAGVPKDARVTRLARYLAAKSEANSSFASMGVMSLDLSDFHWGYLAHDIQYSPMRLDSVKAAKLHSMESSGEKYIFGSKGESIKPNNLILLPVLNGQQGTKVTATFDLGNAKALWTGGPAGGHLKVAAPATSKGCEIFIKSTPSNAAVYFNRKEWYQTTDTSAVRDPGSWEVVVRLEGYKEWRDQRKLNPGESWTINAALIKQ
jgi:hypothetical protein